MKSKHIFLIGGLLLQLCVHAQIPSYVPTDGLVGWWPFNGNANDLSGNSYNGFVNGAVLTADRFGNDSSAYSFSNQGYIITDIASNLPLAASARTMSFWMKTGVFDNPNNRDVFGWGYVAPSQAFYFTVMSGNSYLCGAYDDVPGTYFLADDVWHHVVVTYSGTMVDIYIDGELNVSGTKTFSTALSEIIFGRSPTSHPFPTFYDGLLDDAGVWNRVLTQGEIQTLYIASLPTGFNSPRSSNEITIFPQPSNGFTTIDLSGSGISFGGTIVVENMLGMEVHRETISSSEIKVNTSRWGGKGMYLVHGFDRNGKYTNSTKILCE